MGFVSNESDRLFLSVDFKMKLKRHQIKNTTTHSAISYLEKCIWEMLSSESQEKLCLYFISHFCILI